MGEAAERRALKHPPPDSLELWEGVLNDALGTAGLWRAGLFLHWYSGDLESEAITARRRDVTGLHSLRDELAGLCEDEALIFYKTA